MYINLNYNKKFKREIIVYVQVHENEINYMLLCIFSFTVCFVWDKSH